jgi:hypothetical protein
VLLPTDDGPAQAAAPAPAATEAVGITIRLAALLNRDAKKPAAACADAAAAKGKLLRVKLLIPELQRTRSLSAADLASLKKENKRQRRLLRACAAAGY